MILSSITPTKVMQAKNWADLNLTHDRAGLRSAQRAVHPDVCPDPQASDAFTRLEVLFHAPDADLRLARGTFKGGSVEWKFEVQDKDLAEKAYHFQKEIRNQADGSLWVPSPSLDGVTLTNSYGDGWWFLDSFSKLDERTVVWVVKRLMAAIAVADKVGIVHGDINPKTVALSPSRHGLQLDGWWTGVHHGEPLAVKPTAPTLTKWLNGAGASSKLSVSQAAKMMLDHDCGALRGLLASLWTQPKDPSIAFRELDEASKAKFGKPQWHELAEPNTKPI
jgi:hypothetical protein